MKRSLTTLLLFGLLLVSTTAHAATWAQPNVTSLSGSLAHGEGPWLELPWTIVWEFSGMLGGAYLDPRAVERLPNGNTLITSRDGLGVYEIRNDGSIAWSYTADDHPGLVPFHATRLPNGNTLVVGRTLDTVFEITPEKTIAWQYGSPEDDAKLIDPFTAFRLPNGNTLIADNHGSRVVEISPAGESVWQYGVTNTLASENGYQSGYLDWPKWASRLDNGNTLIADDAGHRVLEIRPDKTTAWSYGQPGIAGSGPGQLRNPVAAERLPNGTTLITDSGNSRALIVDADGKIISEIGGANEYGLGDIGLNEPRRVTATPTGTLLIADTRNTRLLELGYATSGLVTSGQIDCGLPGVRKRFTDLSLDIELPEKTTASLQYRIDNGAWKPSPGGLLPTNTYGMLIQYRVTLATENRAATPRLSGIAIGYEPAPTQGSGGSGDGTGSGVGPGTSANSGGSTRRAPRPGTARPRRKQPGGLTPRNPVNGIMDSSEGYASGSVQGSEAGIAGPVSSRRGWAMERVTTTVDADSLLSGAPMPPPSPVGLILLGGLYAAGALSAPLGRAARAAISLVPTDY